MKRKLHKVEHKFNLNFFSLTQVVTNINLSLNTNANASLKEWIDSVTGKQSDNCKQKTSWQLVVIAPSRKGEGLKYYVIINAD